MEESELHHDRSPLAGVVRELESQHDIDRFLAGVHVQRTTRLRQAIGVLVRLIMSAGVAEDGPQRLARRACGRSRPDACP